MNYREQARICIEQWSREQTLRTLEAWAMRQLGLMGAQQQPQGFGEGVGSEQLQCRSQQKPGECCFESEVLKDHPALWCDVCLGSFWGQRALARHLMGQTP